MAFNPLVSIIIPVYNGSDYLAQAIDSALTQTYQNCEVIVVNDGSNDYGKTEKIAHGYGDKIHYFLKKNGGVASALNFGIGQMKGEYFSWLSHDDLYFENKIEAQIRFIEQFDLYNSIVYSNYETIDATGKTITRVELNEVAPEKMFYHLYVNQSMHGCTLLIPKIAFEEVGLFPEHLLTTQDYELWLLMAKKFPFFRTAQNLVKARQHSEQGSRKLKSHIKDVTDFYERHLEEVLNYCAQNSSPATAKHIKLTILGELLSLCINRRMFKTAMKLHKQGIKLIGVSPLETSLVKRISYASLKNNYHRLPKKVKKLAPLVKSMVFSKKSSLTLRLDFSKIYAQNGFSGSESVSGAGSTMFLTRVVRIELPTLLKDYQITSFLDIPCGDFHWMKTVDFGPIKYIGGDVVEELIKYNQANFKSSSKIFAKIDLLNDKFPEVDLIFCRDCLVHLPIEDIVKAIRNIKSSGAKWLLTTTFTDRELNKDLSGVTWRALNLEKAPFNFPKPTYLMNEKCTEGGGLYGDKCLGLWKISQLPNL